jgi:tRNA(adenine34) deaminase
MNKHDKYMSIAIKEAKKAINKGDIPVGCVIVKNDKIISKSFNKKENKDNSLLHAEICAIDKACKKLKTWRLDDCEIYITLEPCMMCSGAIIQSRIKKVIFGTKNNKFGFTSKEDTYLENEKNNHFPLIMSGVLEKETTELIQNFFIEKRK